MEAGRITSTQMKDWCWASSNTLDLWERKAIRALDSAWFAIQRKAK